MLDSGTTTLESDAKTMELNDTTDYQLCFACGLRNPYGLQMTF